MTWAGMGIGWFDEFLTFVFFFFFFFGGEDLIVLMV